MSVSHKASSGISHKPRICLLSQRNLHRAVFRCVPYEFEDVICQIDEVELLTPEPHYSYVVVKRLANQIARHASFASLNPGIRRIRLNRNYDLFFTWCQFPNDLLSLNAVKGWRKYCRTAVCLLSEVWAGELHKWKGHLKILSQFDYILLHCSESVQPIQNMIQRPCSYIAPGIDTLQFCPYPNPYPRCVDVYYLGRRVPALHQSLLKMAEQTRIFYIYDTIHKMNTLDYRQHRSLLANIAKRSRYFVAHPGKINQPSETHGQSEIGSRFFEGAAAGTVMIGEHPENDAFRENFDWPDVVINVPFDSPNIADILAELDSQPERLEKIRKTNVIQSLLRHDWVYRWRSILDRVGLKPRPALIAREERLKKLAGDIKKTL